MGNLGKLFQVAQSGVRIADRLDEESLGLSLDGLPYLCKIGNINECGGDAPLGECVGKEVVRTPVDGLGTYDVLAMLGQIENGQGDCCRSACSCQCSNSPFKGGNTRFKNILGGV
ncbi:hypothetical protein SDC9_47093 [bioreactor metagenome]|uniref:Uncharacterized protein n=1 Tax=bioreactor metagenome TaxID=1076179 RepID=A0A644WAN5_9ZZZZ